MLEHSQEDHCFTQFRILIFRCLDINSDMRFLGHIEILFLLFIFE